MNTVKNPGPIPLPQPAPAEAATEALRHSLAQALAALQTQPAALLLAAQPGLGDRGAGHLHLVPELFFQVAGHTRFTFPRSACNLGPGQALLLPPLLMHDEQVHGGPAGEAFSNLVLQADGPRLSCHLAHEWQPGRPGIRTVAAPAQHPSAAIQRWLTEAARLGPPAGAAGQPDPWAAAQASALVCAALAAVLRALDDRSALAPPEPVLVARLRVLVHNQLGDASLSVASLARESGCTADHLAQVFRRCTGQPLLAWIWQLRLARAEDLLRQTRMPVKQVAWACGFASAGYFAQCFRRQQGLAPAAWRASQPGLHPPQAAH